MQRLTHHVVPGRADRVPEQGPENVITYKGLMSDYENNAVPESKQQRRVTVNDDIKYNELRWRWFQYS